MPEKDDTVRWRFLDTGKGSAIFNMSLDEMLLEQAEKMQSPTTVRLYSWLPAAISCGYSEKTGKLIDLDKCRSDGVDVVRRPTGGRSVYHDNELAYSVIARIDDPALGGTIEESGRKIAGILCDALNHFGIPAEINRGVPVLADRHSLRPCFLSTSRSEVTLGGKKLVGSAQRRFKHAFLQHGSILTGPGSEKITGYLLDVGDTYKMNVAFRDKSTDIMTYTARETNIGSLKKHVFASFENRLGSGRFDGRLSTRDTEYLEQYIARRRNEF